MLLLLLLLLLLFSLVAHETRVKHTEQISGGSIFHPQCASECHDGFYKVNNEYKAVRISSTTSSHSFSSWCRKEYKGVRSPCTLSLSASFSSRHSTSDSFFRAETTWPSQHEGKVSTRASQEAFIHFLLLQNADMLFVKI